MMRPQTRRLQNNYSAKVLAALARGGRGGRSGWTGGGWQEGGDARVYVSPGSPRETETRAGFLEILMAA